MKADKVKLPETRFYAHSTYAGKSCPVYRIEDFPDGIVKKTWYFRRLSPGCDTPVIEEAKVIWPGMSVALSGDGYIPTPMLFGRIRVAPDGEVWATHYTVAFNPRNGGFSPFHSDFEFPDETGKRRKTIVTHRIKVE